MEDFKNKTDAVNNEAVMLTDEELAAAVGGSSVESPTGNLFKVTSLEDQKCPYGKESPDSKCDQAGTYCEHVECSLDGNHSCGLLRRTIPTELHHLRPS